MVDIKVNCLPGTVIRYGNSKRRIVSRFVEILLANGFNEISIPIMQHQHIFENKVGEENNNLMFNFKDRGGRDVCLAPEYTAVIQQLAQHTFKLRKDVKLFYEQECFRGEKPQLGRWRQFTQFGVEILNPTGYIGSAQSGLPTMQFLRHMAEALIKEITPNFVVRQDVSRGLDYYKEGKGFEIYCPELGACQQVCGGGEYENGMGFAIGIDRLMVISEKDKLRDKQNWHL